MADEAKQAVPFQPAPTTKLTVNPEPSAEFVLMIFPHDVLLTLKNGARNLYKAGVRKVDATIEDDAAGDHWYLKAHGVTVYDPSKPQPGDPLAPLPPVTEHHLKFLQSIGYPQQTVPEAKDFVDGMTRERQEQFFAGALAWEEGDGDDDVELANLTKPDLILFAKKMGLVLDDKLKKDEMITAIVEAQSKTK